MQIVVFGVERMVLEHDSYVTGMYWFWSVHGLLLEATSIGGLEYDRSLLGGTWFWSIDLVLAHGFGFGAFAYLQPQQHFCAALLARRNFLFLPARRRFASCPAQMLHGKGNEISKVGNKNAPQLTC